MGQALSIIDEITRKIDHCEFCDAPAGDGEALEVYVIDRLDPGQLQGFSGNIVILCPGCKRNYDAGLFSKRHLRACVRLRDPELGEWLNRLFDRSLAGQNRSAAGKSRASPSLPARLSRLATVENAVFLSGLLAIVIGVLLFSVGYNHSGGDAVGSSGAGLFDVFLELAGVALAFIGLAFQLESARNFAGTKS